MPTDWSISCLFVRDHVYHPEFNASFSLKSVLPALVPELSYESLEIQDGADASRKLERLLLAPHESDLEEQTAVRRALLEYCRLDTYGLVRLYERLGVMAAATTSTKTRDLMRHSGAPL